MRMNEQLKQGLHVSGVTLNCTRTYGKSSIPGKSVHIYICLSLYCRCLSIFRKWWMYTYLDWLLVDRLPVDWLPIEPPIVVDRLPVGMVAFGSVACRFLRNSS